MGWIQITVMHILSKYIEVNTFMKQEFGSKHPMLFNQLKAQDWAWFKQDSLHLLVQRGLNGMVSLFQ